MAGNSSVFSSSHSPLSFPSTLTLYHPPYSCNTMEYSWIAVENVNFFKLNYINEASELIADVSSLLVELKSKSKFDDLLQLKIHLCDLTRRFEKVKQEIKKLMNGEDDIAEMMELTKKKNGKNVKLDKSVIPHKKLRRLLRPYFLDIDKILNILIKLNETIEYTERSINFKKQNDRDGARSPYLIQVLSVIAAILNYGAPIFHKNLITLLLFSLMVILVFIVIFIELKFKRVN